MVDGTSICRIIESADYNEANIDKIEVFLYDNSIEGILEIFDPAKNLNKQIRRFMEEFEIYMKNIGAYEELEKGVRERYKKELSEYGKKSV